MQPTLTAGYDYTLICLALQIYTYFLILCNFFYILCKFLMGKQYAGALDLRIICHLPWQFLYFFPLPHGQGSFLPG